MRSRAISPGVAKECGFQTRAGALRIPHYDIEGDMWTEQYRPHIRREGGPKYLFRKGTRMGLHVPPSEREKLRDVTVPIILTESALKAAAIITTLWREGLADQYAVIALPGVTTWHRDGGPIPDFEDFPSRIKEPGKDGRFTYRRPIYIAFDSNARTNPMVALEQWKITDQLRRKRKHDVRWIDVPEGPGETVKERERGIDDVLAQHISTMPAMLASAYPAPDIIPAIDLETIAADSDMSVVERLRLERDAFEARALRAERHVSLVTKLAVSPLYTTNEKILILQSGPLAISVNVDAKREDGTIELDAGKLSNDFRPTDKEHPDYEAFKRSPVNPLGDRWYMRRSSVVPTINSLKKKLGADTPIDAKPDYVRNPGDSSPHRVSIITMKRPDNMIDFLEAVNRYHPDTDLSRPYQTQDPCPKCGNVCSRTRHTTCDGCGAETEAPKHLPVPPANDPNATQDQRDDLAKRTANPVNRKNLFTENRDICFPSPAPSINCQDKICLRDGERVSGAVIIDRETGQPIDSETGEIGSAPPATEPAPGICADCGERPAVSHDRTLCAPCAQRMIDNLMHGGSSWEAAS